MSVGLARRRPEITLATPGLLTVVWTKNRQCFWDSIYTVRYVLNVLCIVHSLSISADECYLEQRLILYHGC
jgi:hypothetical protein